MDCRLFSSELGGGVQREKSIAEQVSISASGDVDIVQEPENNGILFVSIVIPVFNMLLA